MSTYIIPKGANGVTASYPHDKKTSFIRPITTEKLMFFTSDDLVFSGGNIIDTTLKATPIIYFMVNPWLAFRQQNEILIIRNEFVIIK